VTCSADFHTKSFLQSALSALKNNKIPENLFQNMFYFVVLKQKTCFLKKEPFVLKRLTSLLLWFLVHQQSV